MTYPGRVRGAHATRLLRFGTLVLGGVSTLLATGVAHAQQPLYVDTNVIITEPMEVGNVVVASGGSLLVANVGPPGFRIDGSLLAEGTGQVAFQSSTVEIESAYHGQYIVLAVDQASITINNCTYRVPAGVQHAIVAAGSAQVTISDSTFDPVQLAAAQSGTMHASRLDGRFEVIVQNDGHVQLADIPRSPGGGVLWVWPEFPAGSTAVYSPPLPGFVPVFAFPPADATGIGQSFVISRCQVLLWPMLVRPGSHLTLRDIAPENWVVVGLHLPTSATISGLRNGETVTSGVLPLADRTLRLENATIDTWNLYPEVDASVDVSDSTIGELLASDTSNVTLRRVTVDGSGGYFGAKDTATVDADASTFTCDVQASSSATVALHRSYLRPYPYDSNGTLTHVGAFDSARILLDHAVVGTTPELGGKGLIAACGFDNPPANPPAVGERLDLVGTVAFYSPDTTVAAGRWKVLAATGAETPVLLGQGTGAVQDGPLGTWIGTDPRSDTELRVVLTDGLGRTLTGRWPVPGDRLARRVLRRR